jgi:plastocyanin
MRSRRLLALPLLATLVVAGCGGGDDEPAASASSSEAPAEAAGATVTIKTFNFAPDPLTVPAGTTITFVNEDMINHSVTSGTRATPGDEFEEGLMEAQGDEFELTLDEPGTYDYFCTFHPGEGMTGKVVVE